MTRLRIRRTARVIVVDQNGAVLLVRYDGPSGAASYWVPPGGGIEPGEEARDAAARELREETGLVAEIGRVLWTCTSEFQTPAGTVRQRETFYWVALDSVTPTVFNNSSEEIREHRWWRVDELLASEETIYPLELRDRLRALFERA